MKKIVFVLLLTAVSAVFPQTLKLGFVDSQLILAQYPAAIKAQSDLDAMIQKWNRTVDSLTTELQTDYMAYQKQEATLTEAAKKTKQADLIEKERKINVFKQEKFSQPRGELYVKQDELLAPVKAAVLQAIEDVAKTEGVKFVFDKSGDIVLLFAEAEYDLTYKVLDKLKRGK